MLVNPPAKIIQTNTLRLKFLPPALEGPQGRAPSTTSPTPQQQKQGPVSPPSEDSLADLTGEAWHRARAAPRRSKVIDPNCKVSPGPLPVDPGSRRPQRSSKNGSDYLKNSTSRAPKNTRVHALGYFCVPELSTSQIRTLCFQYAAPAAHVLALKNYQG